MKRSAEVVICGAGIGGAAAAYYLTNRYGIKDVLLVDERPPLSLTSDKSTECYRNWWPGPGDAMVQMMNHSIDLLEDLAEAHNNVFHLNRRGYLYTTTNRDRIADLEGFGSEASSLGAGELRIHANGGGKAYVPHTAEGFKGAQGGADLITDPELIQFHFPYLSPDIVAVLHVRRAGWLSAQQYGMLLLELAKSGGAQLMEGQMVGVETSGGRVSGVVLAGGEEIETSAFINAAGPLLADVAAMMDVDLPVYHELHQKASIDDAEMVVGREAPLLIDIDPQQLTWTAEEREWLAEDVETAWLLEELPSGAHVRPEGAGQAQSILMLWDTHTEPVPAELPAPVEPMYAETVIRGLCRMLPGMSAYLQRMPKPFTDSGYYTKTEENRPLAGAMPVPGAFVIGAMSGYGIMASAALGELVAASVGGEVLPGFASAFSLERYQDPVYQELLSSWGDSWQL